MQFTVLPRDQLYMHFTVLEKNNKRLEKTKMNRYNMFTEGSFGD